MVQKIVFFCQKLFLFYNYNQCHSITIKMYRNYNDIQIQKIVSGQNILNSSMFVRNIAWNILSKMPTNFSKKKDWIWQMN